MPTFEVDASGLGLWQTASMGGAIVMVVLLVIVMPVAILLTGAVGAAILGGLVKRDRDLDNVNEDGSPNEYLELSRTNPYAD